MKSRVLRGWIPTAIAAALAAANVATAQVTHTNVALSGLAGQTGISGVNYSYLRGTVINASGRVAFLGGLAGSGVTTLNDSGVWTWDAGTRTLVAREGVTTAPGTSPSSPFYYAGQPWLSDTGDLMFRASSSENPSTFNGLVRGTLGNLSRVVNIGDSVPGVPGGVFTAVDAANETHKWMSPNGLVGFAGRYTVGGVTANALFTQEPGGGITRVVGNGDSLGNGLTFGNAASGNFTNQISGMNSSGTFATVAWIQGPGTTFTNDQVLITKGAASPLNVLARLGAIAPGTNVAFTQLSSEQVTLNDSGRVAFWGRLGAGDSGIWTGTTAEDVTLVARQNAPAPDTPNGVNFSGFTANTVSITSTNQIAFLGFLSGSGVNGLNNKGIWYGTADNLRLLARRGDVPAGFAASSGVVYSDIVPTTGSSPFAVTANRIGQIAFTGVLSGTGVTTNNDLAIFALDPLGQNKLILREGDALPVPSGGTRTVQSYSFTAGSGGSDGRPNAFNENGQFTYAVVFTDGSEGVYRADLSNATVDGDTVQANIGGTTTVPGILTVQGNGALNVTNNTTVTTNSLSIGTANGGAGSLSVAAGSGVTSATPVTVASGSMVSNGGALTSTNGPVTNSGSFVNNGTVSGGFVNQAGATLSGTGTINGELTIASNSLLGPGASPGLLTVVGGFTLDGDYDWDLSANDATAAGVTFDRVDVSGVATLGAGSSVNALIGGSVNFGDSFWDSPQEWVILKADGGFATATLPQFTIDTLSYQAHGSFALAHDLTGPTPTLSLFWTPALLVGDYNGSGTVDAADYVVWRKTDFGNPQGYADWRKNFGAGIGIGSSSAGTPQSQTGVPEPATLLLLAFATVGWCLRRDRSA